MKFFNSSRLNLISGSRITKYLAYAVGEIVLVVIGILIAVGINNYKENLASKNRLESYLQVYKQDLEIDSLSVGRALNILEKRKKYFRIFLSDTVSAETFDENPEGYGLVLSYSPFKLQKKGISLLENYVNDTELEQDTLISNILAKHRTYDNLIETSIERIGADIDDNMSYFKNEQPWIADLLLGKMNNPELKSFFLSEKYKAQLVIHFTLVYGNLEPQLLSLQEFNKKTLLLLEKRLTKGAEHEIF